MFYFTGQFSLGGERYEALRCDISTIRRVFLAVSQGLIPQYPQGYDLAGKDAGKITKVYHLLCRDLHRLADFVLAVMSARGDDVSGLRELLWPKGDDMDGTVRREPTVDQIVTLKNAAATAFNSAFAALRIQPTSEGRPV